MRDVGENHAQRMQQKERELMRQMQEQLRDVVHVPPPEETVAPVFVAGEVTTTPAEQDAIRSWLKGLA